MNMQLNQSKNIDHYKTSRLATQIFLLFFCNSYVYVVIRVLAIYNPSQCD